MVRDDYKQSGFPLCNVAPVICIDADCSYYIAYNRFDLVALLRKFDIKTCFGVWPGKKNTDCFDLDPKAYVDMPLPPELHKDIDNANDILVEMESEGAFYRISYMPKDSPDGVRIQSKDPAVYEFVKKAALKFKVKFEE